MLTESKTEENSSFENRNFKTKAAEKIIPQEPKPRGEKKKKQKNTLLKIQSLFNHS